MPTTLKGAEFRSVIADENVLFRVVRSLGRGYWECVGVNEPFEIDGHTYDSDHAGLHKAFSRSEIERALAWKATFEGFAKRQVDFWANQVEGTTLHYHNGFGEYVRGHVVINGGEPQLMPTALVGNWRRFDSRYHAERIAKQDSWQPNVTCVYEAPSFVGPKGEWASFDPTTADALDVEALT